jgi:purine nucleoside phosphorylase
MTYYDQVKEAADAVKARVPELPRIAVVLGSGLGDFAQSLEGGVSCSRLSHRFHTLEPIASQTRSASATK